MIEPEADTPTVPTPTPNTNGTPNNTSELEERLRKLEAALAGRPTLEPAEDAIADRVITKLKALADEPQPTASDRVLVLDSTPRQLATIPEPPKGAVLTPPTPPADPAQRTWFLSRLLGELRLVFRMYFDPHYRISRTTQFALPGIALLLVFNYFFFSVWVSITFFSPVAERLLAVLLGVLGYKILAWELARYRGVLDYMSRYGPR